jgi:hypothetical protein
VRLRDEASLLAWVPRLRRYARALAGTREDADDLVQDTLERAWSRASLWSGVADMRGWLFSIMHNVHADGARRGRLALVALDEETPEVPVPPAQHDRLAVRDLESALGRLPREQRGCMSSDDRGHAMTPVPAPTHQYSTASPPMANSVTVASFCSDVESAAKPRATSAKVKRTFSGKKYPRSSQ